MLNLAALQAATVVPDPFDHTIVDGFVSADAVTGVSQDYPQITATGSFPLSELTYGPAFDQLLSELSSPAVRDAFSNRFDVDLARYVSLITVRGRVGSHDGGVHTDAKWKILSVLLYLNPTWESAGGRLRLLRSKNIEQAAVEVVPKWGTLLAFKRSDHSWHGHLPAEGERRVVQLNWVTSQDKADSELNRHRRSGFVKRLLGRKPY
jgi:SM-20-related protein